MPGRGAFQLSGQLQQPILTAKTGDKLHAYRQVVLRILGQRHRHRRYAGDVKYRGEG